MRTYICAESWRIAPASPDRFRPPTDVYETDEGIEVRVELAGVVPRDIRITMRGNRLEIEGLRRDRDHHKHGYHRMEVAFGRFSSVVELPSPGELAWELITAWYTDGFLYVRAPFLRTRTSPISRSEE